MKKFVLCLLMLVLSSSMVLAADKTQALIAIENARTAINKLSQSGGDNKLVADDITDAKRYLQQAEEVYKDNISWLRLGNLSDAAEPQVRNLAEMSRLAASIGSSKLDKISLDNERTLLEQQIVEAKSKVRVFEDKAKEVAKLMSDAGKYDAAAQEIATLKAEKASLLSQIELLKSDKVAMDKIKQDKLELQKEVESLKSDKASLSSQLANVNMEKASLAGQTEALKTDKALSEIQINKLNEKIVALEKESVTLGQKKEEAAMSGKKLSAANRASAFKAELSKIGALTDITENAMTLVIPRNEIIKTTTKGHQISPAAENNIKPLLSLIQQYPEYKLSIMVFGFGKPAKLENQKAADQMAKMVRDYLALKLGIKSDSLTAQGGTKASALFPKNAAEANKRIELMFTFQEGH